MFFMAELESEARSSAKKVTTWRFQKNNDIEMYIQEVIREAGFVFTCSVIKVPRHR